ncbi:MAG: helix-turn-helix transcriptional regulator [Defluviitaleaceae bacterium]|nr:helix-turn-helix transcriptional regulator [Defluviitaleaceae bacterium]
MHKSIGYTNLKAEMARQDISIKAIAESVGITRDTLSKKLRRKTPITLEEAYAINKIFFPDQDIKYLFSESFLGQVEAS